MGCELREEWEETADRNIDCSEKATRVWPKVRFMLLHRRAGKVGQPGVVIENRDVCIIASTDTASGQQGLSNTTAAWIEPSRLQ